MNMKKLAKPASYLLIFCALVGVLLANVQIHSSAQNTTNTNAFPSEIYSRTKNGVGTEVNYQVGSGYAHNMAITGVDIPSASQFIYSRAGIIINPANVTLLNNAESSVLRGERPLISTSQLADAITNLSLAKLSSLKAGSIKDTIATLKGFDDPNLPPPVRKGRNSSLKLRASSIDSISDQEAVSKLQALQDPNAQALIKKEFNQYIRESLEHRLQIWMAASPNQFSNVNSPYSSSFDGVTPGQAFILAYSFIADDNLLDSSSSLTARMWSVKSTFDKLNPTNPYPEPTNHFAYGKNGYLYSSPTHIFFDDVMQTTLINTLANSK